MVNYCRVLGCHNRSHLEKDFYRLQDHGEDCQNIGGSYTPLAGQTEPGFFRKNVDNIPVFSTLNTR